MNLTKPIIHTYGRTERTEWSMGPTLDRTWAKGLAQALTRFTHSGLLPRHAVRAPARGYVGSLRSHDCAPGRRGHLRSAPLPRWLHRLTAAPTVTLLPFNPGGLPHNVETLCDVRRAPASPREPSHNGRCGHSASPRPATPNTGPLPGGFRFAAARVPQEARFLCHTCRTSLPGPHRPLCQSNKKYTCSSPELNNPKWFRHLQPAWPRCR